MARSPHLKPATPIGAADFAARHLFDHQVHLVERPLADARGAKKSTAELLEPALLEHFSFGKIQPSLQGA